MKRIEDRVGQMVMAGFNGLMAPDYFLDWLREGRLGGAILFARNIESPSQVAELTSQLREAAKYPILIGIDQEGGIVARLRQGFSESPGAMALASIQHDGESMTEAVSGVLAREMQAAGINWNFAPAVDISYNAENPAVGTRSFGSDPARIGQLAAAAVRGFQSNGVAACAKHFPGLGDTGIDTHHALPQLDTSLDHLLAVDLQPYREAIANGLATIMTTHTIFTALDADHPATLSDKVIKRLIRDELGFEGVVTTDCMEMKAIDDHYGVAESAVRGVKAGIDILLFSHTPEKQVAAYDHLLAAVKRGDVPEAVVNAANERIAALKARFPQTAPNLTIIHSDDHQQTVNQAAQASLTLVRSQEGVLPLQPDDSRRVLLVEFTPDTDSPAEGTEAKTPLAQLVKAQHPQIDIVNLPLYPTTEHIAAIQQRAMDVLVIATRSAHLKPEQAAAVRQLSQTDAAVILLALRNPYDATLVEEGTVICTLGDSLTSLRAVSAALTGSFELTGQLPVELS